MTSNSHLLDTVRPHGKPSPAQKRPYSTPTLRILGSAAEISTEIARALLADIDPDPEALLRAYRAAVEREATAWRAVAMQLPGEPGFDPKVWHRWELASLAEREARVKWEASVAASNQSDFAELVWRYIR